LKSISSLDNPDIYAEVGFLCCNCSLFFSRNQIETFAQIHDVITAIAYLSPEQRQALIMWDIEGAFLI